MEGFYMKWLYGICGTVNAYAAATALFRREFGWAAFHAIIALMMIYYFLAPAAKADQALDSET